MPPDDDLSDDELLDALGALVALESDLPTEVVAAAHALHDWSRLDAELAEEVAATTAALRGDGEPRSWMLGEVSITVTVESTSWRRRALWCTITSTEPAPIRVRLQTADGTSIDISPSAGPGSPEPHADVVAGAVRVLMEQDDRRVATPWFTV